MKEKSNAIISVHNREVMKYESYIKSSEDYSDEVLNVAFRTAGWSLKRLHLESRDPSFDLYGYGLGKSVRKVRIKSNTKKYIKRNEPGLKKSFNRAAREVIRNMQRCAVFSLATTASNIFDKLATESEIKQDSSSNALRSAQKNRSLVAATVVDFDVPKESELLQRWRSFVSTYYIQTATGNTRLIAATQEWATDAAVQCYGTARYNVAVNVWGLLPAYSVFAPLRPPMFDNPAINDAYREMLVSLRTHYMLPDLRRGFPDLERGLRVVENRMAERLNFLRESNCAPNSPAGTEDHQSVALAVAIKLLGMAAKWMMGDEESIQYVLQTTNRKWIHAEIPNIRQNKELSEMMKKVLTALITDKYRSIVAAETTKKSHVPTTVSPVLTTIRLIKWIAVETQDLQIAAWLYRSLCQPFTTETQTTEVEKELSKLQKLAIPFGEGEELRELQGDKLKLVPDGDRQHYRLIWCKPIVDGENGSASSWIPRNESNIHWGNS